MIKKIVLIFIILFAFNQNIFGEYRVYQYQVQSRSPSSLSKTPYLIVSTLNPIAYQAYHGGKESLQVDLLRTWMCYGDTSQREYCEAPLSVMTPSEADQEVRGDNNEG